MNAARGAAGDDGVAKLIDVSSASAARLSGSVPGGTSDTVLQRWLYQNHMTDAESWTLMRCRMGQSENRQPRWRSARTAALLRGSGLSGGVPIAQRDRAIR
jgi:hypothetical protein